MQGPSQVCFQLKGHICLLSVGYVADTGGLIVFEDVDDDHVQANPLVVQLCHHGMWDMLQVARADNGEDAVTNFSNFLIGVSLGHLCSGLQEGL